MNFIGDHRIGKESKTQNCAGVTITRQLKSIRGHVSIKHDIYVISASK